MTTTVCKYCNKVELSFSKDFVSKNGKMIPLNKQTGEPHQCSENPYNQHPALPQQQTTATLEVLNSKLDRIILILDGKSEMV